MSTQSDHSHFIVPVKYYVLTFISLLILTVVTVLVAQFDFGVLNLPIALLVASAKASLVLMIFMGMRWEKRFTFVLFLSSLLFLGIFFLLTFSDIGYRQLTDKVEAEMHSLDSPVRPVSDHDTGH
jgi:cytochrome c oxidase subunit 4